MEKIIDPFQRILNAKNIQRVVDSYLQLLSEVPVSIHANSAFDLITKVKRQVINAGPYPHVTLFEAANRIMTDLTILYGVKKLLEGNDLPELQFPEYQVEYGHENNNKHDVMASHNGITLYGEAFNVASTFFQVKKNYSLKKLRKSFGPNTFLLLIYNADAVSSSYVPEKIENEFHLPVSIDLPISL